MSNGGFALVVKSQLKTFNQRYGLELTGNERKVQIRQNDFTVGGFCIKQHDQQGKKWPKKSEYNVHSTLDNDDTYPVIQFAARTKSIVLTAACK